MAFKSAVLRIVQADQVDMVRGGGTRQGRRWTELEAKQRESKSKSETVGEPAEGEDRASGEFSRSGLVGKHALGSGNR